MRKFGKKVLVGTSVVKTLLKFIQDSSIYEEEEEEEEEEESDNYDEEDENLNKNVEMGVDQMNTVFQDVATLSSLVNSKILYSDIKELLFNKEKKFLSNTDKGILFSDELNQGSSNYSSSELSLNPMAKKVRFHKNFRANQSSKIHYHIVSKPGIFDKTPMRKIFMSKKVKLPAPKLDKFGNKHIDLSITPFKQLISKPVASPSVIVDSLVQTTDFSAKGIILFFF